jgi:integrase
MVTKRNGHYYCYFRPFKDKKIGLKLDVESKTEAKAVEAMLLRACRTGDYTALDSISREACVRMFKNQQWELPSGLAGVETGPREELTLWKACEMFLKYPETKAKDRKAIVRYKQAIVNLARLLGKNVPLKALWVPALKAYRVQRINEGAAANTINIELSTLSRVFAVMVELELVETNPCRLLKRLSVKAGERQVYLSLRDVHLIAWMCPEWYQLVVWTAYYTGLRRGEIFDLTRKQVNLKERMITLSPQDTKEAHWKRVPIHHELVPYLKEALRLPSLTSDKVFLVRDGQGIRALGKDTIANPWPRACTALEDAGLLKEPFPRFHDLRHTWRTNARRSGMDYQIAESIMGHWFKGKNVSDRYGRISDQELISAIDLMTFDHGNTEILVARDQNRASKKKGNKKVTNGSRGLRSALGG